MINAQLNKRGLRSLIALAVFLAIGLTAMVLATIRTGGANAAPAVLPDTFRTQLTSVYRITANDLGAQADALPITAQDAIATAESNFGFVHGGLATAYLVSMTDTHSGRVIGTHVPGQPTSFAPTAVDRKVWLVAIPDAQIPIFGPRNGSPAADREPSSYIGTLCVFVDASTGEYFKAVALKI